jgi:hypothetical protein
LPVSKTSNFASYTKDGFTRADHENLADEVTRLNDLGARIILTLGECDLIEAYRSFLSVVETEARRKVNSVSTKRGFVREYIIHNIADTEWQQIYRGRGLGEGVGVQVDHVPVPQKSLDRARTGPSPKGVSAP